MPPRAELASFVPALEVDRAVLLFPSWIRATAMIKYVEMFHGMIDSAEVHTREVVKQALRLNAAAVIVSHNHPSGNPEPSSADKVLTRQLREALALVDVRTLDHIIVAGL